MSMIYMSIYPSFLHEIVEFVVDENLNLFVEAQRKKVSEESIKKRLSLLVLMGITVSKKLIIIPRGTYLLIN